MGELGNEIYVLIVEIWIVGILNVGRPKSWPENKVNFLTKVAKKERRRAGSLRLVKEIADIFMGH